MPKCKVTGVDIKRTIDVPANAIPEGTKKYFEGKFMNWLALCVHFAKLGFDGTLTSNQVVSLVDVVAQIIQGWPEGLDVIPHMEPTAIQNADDIFWTHMKDIPPPKPRASPAAVAVASGDAKSAPSNGKAPAKKKTAETKEPAAKKEEPPVVKVSYSQVKPYLMNQCAYVPCGANVVPLVDAYPMDQFFAFLKNHLCTKDDAPEDLVLKFVGEWVTVSRKADRKKNTGATTTFVPEGSSDSINGDSLVFYFKDSARTACKRGAVVPHIAKAFAANAKISETKLADALLGASPKAIKRVKAKKALDATVASPMDQSA